MGPVIGAAALTLIPEMMHDLEKYRLTVYACLILLTLCFLPNGIMGVVGRLGKRRPHVRDMPAERDDDISTLPRTAGASLKVEAVSRSFGGLRALSDVSFSVEAASIHALIGPNGS